MNHPRTGFYPSVKAEVRAKFREVGATAIYQQCRTARIAILTAMGADPNSPSRWDVINTWRKLPIECSGYEETKQSYDWRNLAQYPTSWLFIPVDPRIDHSKHKTCDWKRRNLSISYDCNHELKPSRQEYIDKHAPECKYTLPVDQVDFE